MVRGGGCTLASDTAAGLSGMIGWRLHVRIPPMMAWGGEQLFSAGCLRAELAAWLLVSWLGDCAGRRYIYFVWRRCILRGTWRHLCA